MPLEPTTSLHAAGSIVGATGLFVASGSLRDQWACGNLVRTGPGDYSFDLDNPIAAAEAIAVVGYRGTPPAFPAANDVLDRESYGALAAPGANLIAAYAAGAPIADAVGPWTMPAPGRTVQIARGGVGVATVYTVTGEGMDGTAGVTDVINSAGAATVQGVRAFRRITNFASDVNPTVTTTLQIGNGFGVGGRVNSFTDLIVTGVLDAATMTAATGTVVPTAARLPNGVRDYDVLFQRSATVAAGGPSLTLVHTTATRKQILIGGAVDGNLDFAILRVVV